MTHLLRQGFGLFAACAAGALTAPQALAQTASAPDELVVTATRRETALQQVPLAVTPVTAELVRNSGIRDIQDLISVAPSLQFNVSENETSATARLRGVGTQGSNPGLESAVGVFIDGVYRARNGVALSDLGEIAQIEVLRGPQGTLFGRNTSAGLINITTAGPDLSDLGFGGEATYGDHGETRVAGYATGPIVRDELGFRLFAARSVRDGFNDVIDAAGNRSESNDRDLWTVRGQALWAPSSDFDLRVIADYSERDEECCTAVFYDPAAVNGASGEGYTASAPAQAAASVGGFGPDGVSALGAGDFSDRTTFANRDTTQDLTDGGVSVEANWTTDIGVFSSVTAYRDWDFAQGQDIDFTAADLLYRAPGDGGFSFQTFTQEFRLAGRAGILDWLVGGFYSNEVLERRDVLTIGEDYGEYWGALNTAIGSPFGPSGVSPLIAALEASEGGGQQDHYRQTGHSLSAFTHNIIAITGSTDLTVGLRYTQEDKDLTAVRLTTAPLTAPLNAFPWHNASLDGTTRTEHDENEWSGLVSVRQEFSSDVSAYISYARGYKGGGFNLDREFDGDNSFAAETVDSYEIGAKTAWLGGDLLVNTAIYSAEFSNFQLNRFTGVTFIVDSVPQVQTRGVELDLIWRMPVDGLSMQGGVAYSDAQYDDDWTAPSGLTNLPGHRLTNSPLWTITDAITYETPMFNGRAMGLAYLDFRYVTDQNAGSDLAAAKEQPSYFLLNGRIGLSSADERIGIEFWGRNLLDEEYAQVMFDAPLQFLAPTLPVSGLRGAFMGDPRTYGITVRAKY